MASLSSNWFRIILFLGLGWFLSPSLLHAQFPNQNNTGMGLFQQGDTSLRDSIQPGKWSNVDAKIYFTLLNSEVKHRPDTNIRHFQSYHGSYPWWGNSLGNFQSSSQSLFFQPNTWAPGLSSGYHSYDLYRLTLDSTRFYNTTNPYSDFTFFLGSKEQQYVHLLHTQNIRPNWNFAGRIIASNSQGFYVGQSTKTISGSLNTDYKSLDNRYHLQAAFIYNHFYQDENGGIVSDSFLTLPAFNDRSRIPTRIPVLNQGRNRSILTNVFRDLDFYLHNSYSWGHVDTTYNSEATKQIIHYIPRFALKHEFRFHSEKHLMSDFAPDSNRYALLEAVAFASQDTLLGQANWNYFSNRFSLNGYIGQKETLMHLTAGLGNRIDLFKDLNPSGYLKSNSFNTFLFGQLIKEAIEEKQWDYEAKAQVYLTGKALGDFDITFGLSKQFNEWLGFRLGFYQSLSSAPHIYEYYATNFFEGFDQSFKQQSLTRLKAELDLPKWHLKAGLQYHLINHYLYFNEDLQAQQYPNAFSLIQAYGSFPLEFGKFAIDNYVVLQQNSNTEVLHLPLFLAREQISFGSYLFQQAIFIRTGIGFSYGSPFYADGYSPLLNYFYVQNTQKINNFPAIDAFFNFRLHHFRAFASFSQLQQFIGKNNLNAPGYPAESPMFRFGFSWILIN